MGNYPISSHFLARRAVFDVAFCRLVQSSQSDSSVADQHEVARVIAVDAGIFILHYMIEEAPMSPEHRQKWIDLLSKAEVY